MRILIVDDEALARSVLQEFLRPHADIEIIGECANGFDAVQAIAELQPDLVFLDIQMPKLNGFDVVELSGQQTRYIFVTAYDQFAIKAFEIHAIDYLLKPFSQQRLDQALAHARSSLRSSIGGNLSGNPANSLAAVAAARPLPLDRILVRNGGKVHIIAVEKIDYIEAQDDYIQIHAEGKSHLKSQRLAELETQLAPEKFLRVHRSFILNIDRISHIEQYAKDSRMAILKDGSKVPVSRSGYQKIRALQGE
jgi:two-component system LytT family response regulator